jgi:hypothetical protein
LKNKPTAVNPSNSTKERRMNFTSNPLLDPAVLREIEKQRGLHYNDQVAFINNVSPLFKSCIDNISPVCRKILILFSEHGTKLTFETIVRYSRKNENIISELLTRLERTGFLERNDAGYWQIKNPDLLRYIFVQFSKFNDWMSRKRKTSGGDIIDQYIANSARMSAN